MTQQVAAVTGAGGFLGRALVARLVADGVHVHAISRASTFDDPRVSTFRADVRDSNALAVAFAGATVVFHLAAHSHDLRSTDDSEAQRAITLGGTLAALAAADRAGIRHFVFASSLAVFGDVGTRLVTEDDPCHPTTPYGRAKLDSEMAVCEFASRSDRFAATIRPAMIYGVGCPGNLPRMIRAIRSRTFPPVPEFGNRRSMISVVDVVEAMLAAWHARVRAGRPFIVTDGQAYSTRQLYEMIRRALGRSAGGISLPTPVFRVAARLGDLGGRIAGRRMPFDSDALQRLGGSAFFLSDRAHSELAFVPRFTLANILPDMIEDRSTL